MMQPDLPIFCAKTYIKVSGHIKDFPFFLIDKYRKLSPEELNAKESSVNMFLRGCLFLGTYWSRDLKKSI